MNDTDRLIAGLCILRGKIGSASFYNSNEAAMFYLGEPLGPETEQILEGYGWKVTNGGNAIYFYGEGDW